MRRIFGSIVLAICTLAFYPAASGIGLIIVEEAPSGATPQPGQPIMPRIRLPRPIERFTPLEIRKVKVTGTIKDQVAHTEIEEEFYNGSSQRLEGTFLLPLPKGAHLQKFAMEVNGKMTEAELLTADKAKGIYEEIVRKAKDPALLEYIGRDLLKVRIFPIEPNSSKRIEISYDQLLKSDAGLVEYSLPLNTAQYSSSPIGSFAVKLHLESSTPLKSIYSPSHSIEVIRNKEKTATLGLEANSVRPEKDFQLFYSAEASELGVNFLTYKKPGEDGYFMLLASPGVETSREKVMAKDVVFVLDTSGSMAGKKLAQAKKALTFCVNSLNRDDRFEIIRFATETESLFRKLTPFSDAARGEAESFVDNLKTIGGTAINDALKKALEIRPKEVTRPFLVVFLTDGLPTVGDTSESAIVRTATEKQRDLTRIFCFGIGTDVNTRLLDRIAEETSAVSQYVLPEEDLEIKVSSFFSKISDPVLAGVDLDFGKVRTSKVHPGKLPDLFRGQQLLVFGRYGEGGKSTATVSGKVADREQRFTYDLDFPERASEHAFIPRLWATRRIGYLLEEARSHGESGEIKEEVTELARKYGIVTPYTSFLVQEDQPVRELAERLGRRNDLPRLYDSLSTAPRAPLLVEQEQRTSGDAAVASARYRGALKSAVSEEQLVLAGREVQLYASTGKLQAGGAGPAPTEVLTRAAAGRTFRQEGEFWSESGLPAVKDAEVRRIVFDSPEYWKFVNAHPDLREVLALGTRVKFLLDGKVYEIVPDSADKTP